MTTTSPLIAHKYANLFPMMSDAELQDLAADIKAHGFRKQFPIITLDNKILDGRNREKASQIAGVQPIMEEYTGDDPLALGLDQRPPARRHRLKVGL